MYILISLIIQTYYPAHIKPISTWPRVNYAYKVFFLHMNDVVVLHITIEHEKYTPYFIILIVTTHISAESHKLHVNCITLNPNKG